MYKIEISLGWEEKVVIETDDFNKIALIQEFIALQEDCDWCAEDEEEDDELSFTDEDGNVWFYDEDLDEWIEWVEDEEEEDEDQE
jgi:hypothetical protein